MRNNINIEIDLKGLWEISVFVNIIFLILKLTHLIDWAWIWIFSPVLIVLGIWVILAIIILVMYFLRKV